MDLAILFLTVTDRKEAFTSFLTVRLFFQCIHPSRNVLLNFINIQLVALLSHGFGKGHGERSAFPLPSIDPWETFRET
jgi:hypothetical protein